MLNSLYSVDGYESIRPRQQWEALSDLMSLDFHLSVLGSIFVLFTHFDIRTGDALCEK